MTGVGVRGQRLATTLAVLERRVAIHDARIRLLCLQRALARCYSPDQPRVPRGNPDGGQWTRIGGGPSAPAGELEEAVRQAWESLSRLEPEWLHVAAGYEWGSLLVEIARPGGGRYCVYRFELHDVLVSGPTNFRCQGRVPSSAVEHGTILIDNRRR